MSKAHNSKTFLVRGKCPEHREVLSGGVLIASSKMSVCIPGTWGLSSENSPEATFWLLLQSFFAATQSLEAMPRDLVWRTMTAKSSLCSLGKAAAYQKLITKKHCHHHNLGFQSHSQATNLIFKKVCLLLGVGIQRITLSDNLLSQNKECWEISQTSYYSGLRICKPQPSSKCCSQLFIAKGIQKVHQLWHYYFNITFLSRPPRKEDKSEQQAVWEWAQTTAKRWWNWQSKLKNVYQQLYMCYSYMGFNGSWLELRELLVTAPSPQESSRAG